MYQLRWEILALFGLCFSAVKGDVVFPASCSEYNVTGETDFDLKQVSGTWYYIASYDNDSCTVNNISVVNSTTLKISKITFKEIERDELFNEFLASRTDNSTGKFTVTNPSGTLARREDYYIIKSDFNSYLVGWSCGDVEINGTTQSSQNLWIFSRNTSLTTNERFLINQTLTALNISQAELQKVQQDPKVCGSGASEQMKTTINVVIVFALISIYLTK